MNERRGLNLREVLIAVGIVILIGLMGLAVYSQYGKLQDARAAVAAEKQAIAAAQAKLAHLQALKANEVELRAQLAYMEKLIPSEPAEDQLLIYLQSAAKFAGIRLVQVRFQSRVVTEKYVEMPLTLTFEGRYTELLSLLNTLRNGSRLINVENVRIGQGTDLFPQIRVEITGRAFFLQSQ
jgi:Tfp pilus assembly protein PilO